VFFNLVRENGKSEAYGFHPFHKPNYTVKFLYKSF